MKRSLHASRGTMAGRKGRWVQAAGPAQVPGPRPAFAAGLIAALALVQPASSLAWQHVALSVTAAGDTIGVDTLSATPDAEPPGLPATPAGGAETRLGDRSAVAADLSDTLPFAQNEVPESFPSVGFSIGVGGYVSSFAAVERAFHAMEDVHRAGGFSVPRAADVRLGPILLPTLKVRLNRWLDVAFQMGRTLGSKSGGDQEPGSTDQLTLMGGLVSGRLSPAGRVSLLAGLGGGMYRFSVRRDYGVRVSPTDGSGGFYELESITLEGGGGYWTTAGGLSIRAWPRGTLDALAQYVGTGDVSTNATSAGDVRVNMSGTMIAVSITSHF